MEIEIKFRVEDFESVKACLEKIQARYVDCVLQTDTYFDSPEGKLLLQSKGLRVRDVDGKDAQLTFKGPRQPHDQLKIRPEYQIDVSDGQSLMKILEGLDLVESIVIQKKRITYRLGDYEILLDELPLIGKFVEIEGPDEKEILKIADKLKLTGQSLTDHYIKLILAESEKREITSRRFVFE